MVEIKAELLKWCPGGFGFWTQDPSSFDENKKYVLEKLFLGFIEGALYCHSAGSMVHYRNQTCFVDPIAYEKAVIDRIKEMVPLAEIIQKACDHIIWLKTKGNEVAFEILADPRPWESEYVIEVNHG